MSNNYIEHLFGHKKVAAKFPIAHHRDKIQNVINDLKSNPHLDEWTRNAWVGFLEELLRSKKTISEKTLKDLQKAEQLSKMSAPQPSTSQDSPVNSLEVDMSGLQAPKTETDHENAIKLAVLVNWVNLLQGYMPPTETTKFAPFAQFARGIFDRFRQGQWLLAPQETQYIDSVAEMCSVETQSITQQLPKEKRQAFLQQVDEIAATTRGRSSAIPPVPSTQNQESANAVGTQGSQTAITNSDVELTLQKLVATASELYQQLENGRRELATIMRYIKFEVRSVGISNAERTYCMQLFDRADACYYQSSRLLPIVNNIASIKTAGHYSIKKHARVTNAYYEWAQQIDVAEQVVASISAPNGIKHMIEQLAASLPVDDPRAKLIQQSHEALQTALSQNRIKNSPAPSMKNNGVNAPAGSQKPSPAAKLNPFNWFKKKKQPATPPIQQERTQIETTQPTNRPSLVPPTSEARAMFINLLVFSAKINKIVSYWNTLRIKPPASIAQLPALVYQLRDKFGSGDWTLTAEQHNMINQADMVVRNACSEDPSLNAEIQKVEQGACSYYEREIPIPAKKDTRANFNAHTSTKIRKTSINKVPTSWDF